MANLVFIAPAGAIDVAYLQTSIEVFTTSSLQFSDTAATIEQPHQNIDLQIYELNGIQFVEADLSRNLTADPEQSKHQILQRIQVLDEQTKARMQRSAIGLTKVMHYGINRYPAIVIDGEALVYGVTDLQSALTQYQAWHAP